MKCKQIIYLIIALIMIVPSLADFGYDNPYLPKITAPSVSGVISSGNNTYNINYTFNSYNGTNLFASINLTQMDNSTGTLNILESWLDSIWARITDVHSWINTANSSMKDYVDWVNSTNTGGTTLQTASYVGSDFTGDNGDTGRYVAFSYTPFLINVDGISLLNNIDYKMEGGRLILLNRLWDEMRIEVKYVP